MPFTLDSRRLLGNLQYDPTQSNRWLLPGTGLHWEHNALTIEKASTHHAIAYHGMGYDGAWKVQVGAIRDMMRHFGTILDAQGGKRRRRQARKGAQAGSLRRSRG